jgi:DNA gyrase subunit B
MTRLHHSSAVGTPFRTWGVGLCVVNALSSKLELKIRRDGKEHMVRFRNGVAEAPLHAVGPADGRHGIELTFRPCPEIFGPVAAFDHAVLERRLRELAFLVAGVRVVLTDDRPGGRRPQRMCYANGVSDFVRHLDRSRRPLLDAPIAISGEHDGIAVEAALWWNDTARERVLCFTNNLLQPHGGTHLAGFHVALDRVMGRYAQAHCDPGDEREPITGDDARQGLTAVVAVRMPFPALSGEVGNRLTSPEVRPVVERIVAARLAAWLDAHPDEAKAILGKAWSAASGHAVYRFAQRLPTRRT